MAWATAKTPWSAPSAFGNVGGHSAPGFGAPAGQPVVGQAWSGNVTPDGKASSTPAPLLGGAVQDTAPNAGFWDPETKTVVSREAYSTLANQNLGGYGTFAGAGSYPGDTRQPPQPVGTLEGPGTLETAWSEHGNEFFQPGPAGTFFGDTRDEYTQPTNTEQYFNGVSGSSAPQTENRADQAYDQYQRNMPTLLSAPDLSTYYDVAEERAQRSLGDAQAARGVFGSSVASGQAGDLSRGLRAEQANREADYNIARNADFRASLLGASQAGRAGDITDLSNADNELSWRAMLGNLAGAADAASLGRLGLGVTAAANAGDERLRGLSGGMAAAGAAQGAEEGRERGALQDMTGLYQLLSSLGLGTYQGLINTDMDLLDGEISGGIAGATTAYGMDERHDPTAKLAAILDALGGAKKAGLF